MTMNTNPTGRADELRDTLAAIIEALDDPGSDAPAEKRQAWRELVPVRAILVCGVAEAILASRSDAEIAGHVRYLRGRIRRARGER